MVPFLFSWVNELWSTAYRLLKPEYQTADMVQMPLSLLMVLVDRQLGLGLRINQWALVIAPAYASFVPALANQAYTTLVCAFCASFMGL